MIWFRNLFRLRLLRIKQPVDLEIDEHPVLRHRKAFMQAEINVRFLYLALFILLIGATRYSWDWILNQTEFFPSWPFFFGTSTSGSLPNS